MPVRSAPVEPVASTRARAPSRRARLDELPKPPWAPFPLVELCILIGLLLMVIGFVAGGDRRPALILAGVGLTCLAGLEQATREHFAAYRSHTSMLAGFCAAVVAGTTLALGLPYAVAMALAVAVLAGAFWALRRAFLRRSGVGFRV